MLPWLHSKALYAVVSLLLTSSLLAQNDTWPHSILRGDYPDPTILRDGGDYYMTHSPFIHTPCFLIWHSTDPIHSEPICRAMTDVVGSAMAQSTESKRCYTLNYLSLP